MKIKINGQDIQIEDSESLVIEVQGDLSILNIVEGVNISVLQNSIVSMSANSANIINTNAYTGDIKVCVTGNVEKVKTTNGSVSVKGSSGDIKSTNGNIDINNNVTGDIKTTNGNVIIKGDFSGKVKTVNGNIRKN